LAHAGVGGRREHSRPEPVESHLEGQPDQQRAGSRPLRADAGVMGIPCDGTAWCPSGRPVPLRLLRRP
jgi:hypothetical protein